MKLFNFRKKDKSERAKFGKMEEELSSFYISVKPRPEFVSELRNGLASRYTKSFSNKPKRAVKALLVGVTGLFSGTLVLVFIVRTMVTFVSMVGILNWFKQQSKEEGIAFNLSN